MAFSKTYLYLVSLLLVLPALVLGADSSPVLANDSPVLAGPLTPHCAEGARYHGTATGKNLTIAGVPTYVTSPKPSHGQASKKAILFFSDIYGPFHDNNFMLQDYFASQGFHVFGIDYFFGDPIHIAEVRPGFNRTAWSEKSRKQAEENVPKWTEAVVARLGAGAKLNAVGYCFGAPYSVSAASTDVVQAAAFAHPSGLNEAHFYNAKKPLLLSCAETDGAFPTASQRRAVDILVENKSTYLVQVFSGVSHGFATRADPADANAVWAKEESARSVAGWFNRFSK